MVLPLDFVLIYYILSATGLKVCEVQGMVGTAVGCEQRQRAHGPRGSTYPGALCAPRRPDTHYHTAYALPLNIMHRKYWNSLDWTLIYRSDVVNVEERINSSDASDLCWLFILIFKCFHRVLEKSLFCWHELCLGACIHNQFAFLWMRIFFVRYIKDLKERDLGKLVYWQCMWVV